MPPVKRPLRNRHRTYVREWREHRQKPQAEVADALGIDPGTLSRLENGKIPYNQDVLEKLALIYGCDAADLIQINPLDPDAPRVIYNELRRAPPETQHKAIEVLKILLKAG